MKLTWLCTGSALVLKGRTNLPYTPPAGGGGVFPAATLFPALSLFPGA